MGRKDEVDARTERRVAGVPGRDAGHEASGLWGSEYGVNPSRSNVKFETPKCCSANVHDYYRNVVPGAPVGSTSDELGGSSLRPNYFAENVSDLLIAYLVDQSVCAQ